jgi:glycosidase
MQLRRTRLAALTGIAVKDYYAIEPALGTFDDLKHFVQAAHELGFFVLLD